MKSLRSLWSRPLLPLLVASAFVAVGCWAVMLVLAPAHAIGTLTLAVGTPTVSTTELDPIMKVLANRPLYNNTIAESEFSDIIMTNTEGIQTDQTTGGRYIENAHRMARSSGYRGMSDGGYIPIAEAPVFKNTRTYLRQGGYTLQMTGTTMRRVVGDEGSFVNYLENELPEAARNMAHDDDRLLLGYGYDVRARISSVSGSSGSYTIVLKDTLGVSGWTDAWTMFSEGDQLVFTSSLAATIALRGAGANQRAIVRDMDEAANSITVECTDTLGGVLAPDDYIGTGDTSDHNFPHGSGLTPMVPQGFLSAIDDGMIATSYMNLARSGNRLWKGIVVDGSASPWGGSATEGLVLFAVDEAARKGGGNITALVGSYSSERGLRASFSKDRFFMDAASYKGGRVPLYLQLGNRVLQLKFARKVPPQLMLGIDGSTWTHHTLGAFEWDDTTGSIWNRVVDSTGPKDAYYATGNKYDEYFCVAPRRNFRIQGLSANQA